MLRELVKIANKLDLFGLTKEADFIDQEIIRLASDETDESVEFEGDDFKKVLSIKDIEKLLNTKVKKLSAERASKKVSEEIKEVNERKEKFLKSIISMEPFERFYNVVISGVVDNLELQMLNNTCRELINDLFAKAKVDFLSKKEDFYSRYLSKIGYKTPEGDATSGTSSSESGATGDQDYISNLDQKVKAYLKFSVFDIATQELDMEESVRFFDSLDEHKRNINLSKLGQDKLIQNYLADVERNIEKLEQKVNDAKRISNKEELTQRLTEYDKLDFYNFYLKVLKDKEEESFLKFLIKEFDKQAKEKYPNKVLDSFREAFKPVYQKFNYTNQRIGKYKAIEAIETSPYYNVFGDDVGDYPDLERLFPLYRELQNLLNTHKTNETTSLPVEVNIKFKKLTDSLKFAPEFIRSIPPLQSIKYLEELERNKDILKYISDESKLILINKLHEARKEGRERTSESRHFGPAYTKRFLDLLNNDEKDKLKKLRSEGFSYTTKGRGMSAGGIPLTLSQPDLYESPEVETSMNVEYDLPTNPEELEDYWAEREERREYNRRMREMIDSSGNRPQSKDDITALRQFTREDAKALQERVEKQKERSRRRPSSESISEESDTSGTLSSVYDINPLNFYVIQLTPKFLPQGEKHYWIVKREVSFADVVLPSNFAGDERDKLREYTRLAKQEAEELANSITESYNKAVPKENVVSGEGVEGEAIAVSGSKLIKMMNDGIARLHTEIFQGPVALNYGPIGRERIYRPQESVYEEQAGRSTDVKQQRGQDPRWQDAGGFKGEQSRSRSGEV